MERSPFEHDDIDIEALPTSQELYQRLTSIFAQPEYHTRVFIYSEATGKLVKGTPAAGDQIFQFTYNPVAKYINISLLEPMKLQQWRRLEAYRLENGELLPVDRDSIVHYDKPLAAGDAPKLVWQLAQATEQIEAEFTAEQRTSQPVWRYQRDE